MLPPLREREPPQDRNRRVPFRTGTEAHCEEREVISPRPQSRRRSAAAAGSSAPLPRPHRTQHPRRRTRPRLATATRTVLGRSQANGRVEHWSPMILCNRTLRMCLKDGIFLHSVVLFFVDKPVSGTSWVAVLGSKILSLFPLNIFFLKPKKKQ